MNPDLHTQIRFARHLDTPANDNGRYSPLASILFMNAAIAATLGAFCGLVQLGVSPWLSLLVYVGLYAWWWARQCTSSMCAFVALDHGMNCPHCIAELGVDDIRLPREPARAESAGA